MKNLLELDLEEIKEITGGGNPFYDLGHAIGYWLGKLGTSNGNCDHFSDSEIIGSASNNYTS